MTFDEDQIFAKINLFGKRVSKLLDMFTTIKQFTTLNEKNSIDGLVAPIKAFFKVVEEFKRKPYDLMDFAKNQFDRDYLEFNVSVHELETNLQDSSTPASGRSPPRSRRSTSFDSSRASSRGDSLRPGPGQTSGWSSSRTTRRT